MHRIALCYLRLLIQDRRYQTVAVQSSIYGGWLLQRPNSNNRKPFA